MRGTAPPPPRRFAAAPRRLRAAPGCAPQPQPQPQPPWRRHRRRHGLVTRARALCAPVRAAPPRRLRQTHRRDRSRDCASAAAAAAVVAAGGGQQVEAWPPGYFVPLMVPYGNPPVGYPGAAVGPVSRCDRSRRTGRRGGDAPAYARFARSQFPHGSGARGADASAARCAAALESSATCACSDSHLNRQARRYSSTAGAGAAGASGVGRRGYKCRRRG